MHFSVNVGALLMASEFQRSFSVIFQTWMVLDFTELKPIA